MNRKRFEEVLTPVRETTLPDLVGLILLIGIIFYSLQNIWFYSVHIQVFSILGLVIPAMRRSSWFWFITGIVMFIAIYSRWASVDNHKYLYVYMCLQMGVVYLAPEIFRTEVLRKSACWLLAIVFLIAVLQKLANPEYNNGAFFRYTLLTDTRFEKLPYWISGVSKEELGHNQGLREAISSATLPMSSPLQIKGWDKVGGLAFFMTWWTICIETLIPISFLVSSRSRLAKYRHYFLWTFIVTTYPVAPVLGFAWLLMTLGLSQSEDDPAYIRYTYFFIYAALPLAQIPWQLAKLM